MCSEAVLQRCPPRCPTYFLNNPSSRLDSMHPQHPCLEEYLKVNITQQRNPQMKCQVWNPETRSRLKISFRDDQSCLP